LSLEFRTGEDLAATAPSRLFADWLRGGTELGAAAADLGRVEGLAPRAAPWFAAGGPGCWAETMTADLPGVADRERFRADAAALAAGEARVVVTGQQPGFAGGPLLTVLKIATACALARRETARGRPTVPVFWLGDDDDDLREAYEPVLWDPAGDSLWASDLRPAALAGTLPRRRLSGFALPEGQEPLGTWLERFAAPEDELGLHDLWREESARGRTWSSLFRRALLRIFTGEGLVIVSGDDDALHEAAAPFYRELVARRLELGQLARRRGGELTARGWHAQLGKRSLERPLFRTAGPGRIAVREDETGTPAAKLRPGVLLRSPVQDWLLAPAAVVVGPAEAAYLRQLDPLYDALGLRRCPLVPRLTAWLLPPDFDRGPLVAGGRERLPRGAPGPAWLDDWLESATADLARHLAEGLDLGEERAWNLAAGRVRRWRKGLHSLVAGEARRQAESRPGRGPAWILPEGRRQERRLAWYGALARWGMPLRDALLAAAVVHLEEGAGGNWRELEITVDDAEDNHDRQP